MKRYQVGDNLVAAGSALLRVGSAVEVLGLSLGVVDAFALHDRTARTASLALSYGGPALDGLGFGLEVAGLFVAHDALDGLDHPIDRGLLAAGTTFGLLGMVALGGGVYFSANNDTLYADPIGSGPLGSIVSRNDAAVAGCLAVSSLLLLISQEFFSWDRRRLEEHKMFLSAQPR